MPPPSFLPFDLTTFPYQMIHPAKANREFHKSIPPPPSSTMASNPTPPDHHLAPIFCCPIFPMNFLRQRAKTTAAIPNPIQGNIQNLQSAGDGEGDQWRPVADLKDEGQLDQLARIYRCSISLRTDAHVLLNCAQMGSIRCQFKFGLLFLRKEGKLFAKGQHNHLQTLPLWELPEGANGGQGNGNKQKQMQTKGKAMRGWRFLKELNDAAELREFGGNWKQNMQNNLTWHCALWPKCRFRLCWQRENQALFASGEHNHQEEEEEEEGGNGLREREGEGGAGKRKNTEGNEQPKGEEKRQKRTNEGGEEEGENGEEAERPRLTVKIALQQNKNTLGMGMDEQSTPPYHQQSAGGGNGPSSSSAFEALTPENGEQRETAAAGRMGEGNGGENSVILIEDSENEEGRNGQKEGEGEKEDEGQIGNGQNGQNEGEKRHLEGNDPEEGERGEPPPYPRQNGEDGNPPAAISPANAPPQFRLADLEGEFREVAIRFGMHLNVQRDGEIVSLTRMEEAQLADGERINSNDSLIFEDKGHKVNICESRARQWQRQNGRIVGRWVKGQQQWGKADKGQFMMAVRGSCDQLLGSQPQWE